MHFALPPNLPGPFETLSRNGTQNRAKKTCAPNHVNKEPWEARPPNVPGAFETLTPQSRSKKDLGRHCPQIYQVRLKPRNSAQNSEKKKKNKNYSFATAFPNCLQGPRFDASSRRNGVRKLRWFRTSAKERSTRFPTTTTKEGGQPCRGGMMTHGWIPTSHKT